jgi:hypothetical protein
VRNGLRLGGQTHVVPRSPDRGTRTTAGLQEIMGDHRSGPWPGQETGPQPGRLPKSFPPPDTSRFPAIFYAIKARPVRARSAQEDPRQVESRPIGYGAGA